MMNINALRRVISKVHRVEVSTNAHYFALASLPGKSAAALAANEPQPIYIEDSIARPDPLL
jgi:hypothetical protein